MNKNRLFRILSVLVIIPLALSLSAGGQLTHWRFERIDADRTFRATTNSSLKLYNGLPQVVYGADHLYYATLSSGAQYFDVTTVDSNWAVGSHASLAIEPTTGHPRISYYDEGNQHLKYAQMNVSGFTHYWTITTVDSDDADPVIGKTAIVLDNSTYHLPHIAYIKQGGHIWHAWQTCSGSPPFVICSWHTEEVDATVSVSGINISLAIDSLNNLHMAYFDDNASVLNYAFYNGSSWLTYVVPEPYLTTYGTEPSLALDSNNRPAIAYIAPYAIRYAWKTGDNLGDWDFDTIYECTGPCNFPDYPSLQLPGGDPTQPWISFIDGDSLVRLAVYGEGACPGNNRRL